MEALMREGMQWWGFSELLNFNPKSGGVEMSCDNSKRKSTVNRKSKTIFKKGRKVMKTKISIFTIIFAAVCMFSFSPAQGKMLSGQPYACEEDLIEVMFAQDSKVRVRGGELVDLKTNALAGVDEVLAKTISAEWHRICDVPEERLDQIHARGEANTGKSLYNLNNIYRLRISNELDVWQISRELEALPGIMLARPVPKPMPLPWPGYYEPQQGYLDPASSTPSGIDARYAWGWWPGGEGSGVTVCDLEYSWNYNHGDLTKAPGSQINSNVADPFGDNNHGTAVIGELVSDKAAWGTTGICYAANLKTCGTYYGTPYPSWNVAGAMAVAIANLSPGDVILLEQQWDYGDTNTYQCPDYIPIEWWGDTYPNAQSRNAVYVAIENAIANGIHVVECGGNGGAPVNLVGYNTDNLTWYGNSGAIIVGAGGIKTAGQYPEGDLERLCFSSYGSRLDLQGWGEEVVTTGYGHLWIADGINYAYTDSFAGTSSAAPIIAGAVTCCVGYWKNYVSPALPSPQYIRSLLISTGTPQVNPASGHIGPRPDLQAAFAAMYQAYYWVDATSSPLNGSGYGVAWGDYDNDGDQDLYVSNYSFGSKLYRNDGGGVFTSPFASTTPPNDNFDGTGVAWGDYDNDGDLDLYLAQANGQANKLFRNDGGGVFTDATNGLPLGDTGTTYGIAWGDYDNDGDIDLYIANFGSANKLLRNDGGGVFVDATGGTPLGDAGDGCGVVWGDYDNDGDLDLYLVNGSYQANKLFRNDGGGSFSDVTGPPLNDALFGIGAAWGDYDNDGDLDLYLVNGNMGANKLFRNNGGGSFTDVTSGPLGDASSGYGCAWGDYDNDGDLDLYLTNGGSPSNNKLFRNDGGGVFVDATSPILGDPSTGIGVAFGDYDNDGDIDLYVAHNYPGQNKLFRNEIGTANHWLHVDLVGTTSNSSAIGTRLRIVVGVISQIREISGGSGFCSQNSLTAEFGLGLTMLVDTLEIMWPSGQADTLTALAADQLVTIYEGGSSRGDANGDGVIDLGDILFLISYLYKGGPAPNPLWTGDANSDGLVDLGDVLYLVSYLYKGGPAPCPGKGEVSSTLTSKLSSSLGHAELRLQLKTDHNPVGFSKASPEGFDQVFQISVVGEFDRDVAGVHLEMEFDPDEVILLDPELTSLTKDLQLFSGTKDGIQKIGMVDLSGKNFLSAAEGTLVNLRANGKDLTSIKIKKATLFGVDAMPLDLDICGELRFKGSENSESTPQHFSLSQNYPNPFNPQTSINYALPQDAQVRLILYNILGEKVKTLVDERQSAGYKMVWWDGRDERGDKVASGVYFYRMEADKFTDVKKMLLVK